jgi:RNA polymerase sigma-70 factor (ECF subfamily)
MVGPDTSTEEDLIRAVQSGGLEAFDELYKLYLPMVYNRVRYVIPAEDVEDVTQEIFIAVLRSLGTFRFEARFSTWLRTLVNRQVANYYRRRSIQDCTLDGIDDSDPDRIWFLKGRYDMDGLDERIVLRQALLGMPEHYREVILLRFADGLQFDEIANLQRQSLDATKSLFRRAIASLQKQVIDA